MTDQDRKKIVFRSPAKTHMYLLIKNYAFDEVYSFYINGTEAEANKLIHQIRVELSRVRAKVKARGRVLVPFKVIRVDVTETQTEDNKPLTCIQLKKIRPNHAQTFDDLQPILKELDAGARLNG